MKKGKYCPLLITCLLIGVLVSGCGGAATNSRLVIPVQFALWFLQGQPPEGGSVVYDACFALRNTSDKMLIIDNNEGSRIRFSYGSQKSSPNTWRDWNPKYRHPY